jgi:hypothetical protein
VTPFLRGAMLGLLGCAERALGWQTGAALTGDLSRERAQLRNAVDMATTLLRRPPTLDTAELDALAAHVGQGAGLEPDRASALIEALREERATSAALAAELEELRAEKRRPASDAFSFGEYGYPFRLPPTPPGLLMRIEHSPREPEHAPLRRCACGRVATVFGIDGGAHCKECAPR